MGTKCLNSQETIERLLNCKFEKRDGYRAMYSTWIGGITTDPRLMLVPVDDHVVHRGDGVFEAIKAVRGKPYQLRPHLERLQRSADGIGLKLRFSLAEIEAIAIETLGAAGAKDSSILRLYCTRGPGGFSTNPRECIDSQMYLIITDLAPMPEEKYRNGVAVGISQVPIKEGKLATIKSCNYLPNVLMKMESLERGLDFVISQGSEGGLGEGSTENFAVITSEGDFVVPDFSRVLRGITAVRAMELAREKLVPKGLVRAVRNGPISLATVKSAREAFLLGTTLDCLSVTGFEDFAIGDGKPGPVSRELRELLLIDMA